MIILMDGSKTGSSSGSNGINVSDRLHVSDSCITNESAYTLKIYVLHSKNNKKTDAFTSSQLTSLQL